MTTLVRTDRVSGYKWVDFYVDQAGRWNETISWRTSGVSLGTAFGEGGFGLGAFGGTGGGTIDVSGYTARFVVIRAGLDETPVFDLVSPSDITIDGPAGSFSWDVPAVEMARLTHPVFQHKLTVFAAGDETRARSLAKGRVLVRATARPVSPSPGTWGHGPYGGV